MEMFYLTTHSTHFSSSFFIIIFTSFVIGRLITTLKKKILNIKTQEREKCFI